MLEACTCSAVGANMSENYSQNEMMVVRARQERDSEVCRAWKCVLALTTNFCAIHFWTDQKIVVETCRESGKYSRHAFVEDSRHTGALAHHSACLAYAVVRVESLLGCASPDKESLLGASAAGMASHSCAVEL